MRERREPFADPPKKIAVDGCLRLGRCSVGGRLIEASSGRSVASGARRSRAGEPRHPDVVARDAPRAAQRHFIPTACSVRCTHEASASDDKSNMH